LKIKKIKYDLILFGSLVFVLLLFFDTFDFLPKFALNFLKNNVIVWLIYLFFLVCFKGEMFNKFLKIPFVSIVGSMCYSIYLTHGFIITMLIMLFKNIIDTGSFVGDFIILFCIVSPITLIFCSIFYLIFERPFMKHDWPNRILSFFCSASKSKA
jgi:peptidoglycan/LPS O-acetylase OafA/YrhL